MKVDSKYCYIYGSRTCSRKEVPVTRCTQRDIYRQTMTMIENYNTILLRIYHFLISFCFAVVVRNYDVPMFPLFKFANHYVHNFPIRLKQQQPIEECQIFGSSHKYWIRENFVLPVQWGKKNFLERK